MRIAATPKAFPVEDDFFSPLSLSSQRLAQLRAQVDSALNDTLKQRAVFQRSRDTYLDGSAPWRLHAEYEALKAYSRPHGAVAHTQLSQIFGTVQGNFLDIAHAFKTTQREDYYSLQKRLFDSIVDAHVVHNVHSQPGNRRYEGIKWTAYKVFAARSRFDSCQFESIGAATDAAGKPFTFRVLLPVVVAEVPDLMETKNARRVSQQSVMIFAPSDRSDYSTELFVAMEYDVKHHRIPGSALKRHMSSLHRISSTVDSRRLSSHSIPTVRPARSPSENEHNCSVCARQFSLLRSKHSCSICGGVVCRKCFVKSSRLLILKPVTHAAAPPKMCTLCIKRVREDVENAVVKPRVSVNDFSVWRKTYHLDKLETPTGNALAIHMGVSSSSVNHDHHDDEHSTIWEDSSRTCSHYDDTDEEFTVGDDGEEELMSRPTLELDTCQMARVYGSSVASSDMTRTTASSPELFDTIHSSLQEMEMLVQQLKLACRQSSQ